MTSEAPESARTEGLRAGLAGRLIQPGDPGYDEARRVHNGLVDKRPRIIARCRGVADVVDAIRLARELGLEVAVRGGGHNVAGRAMVDDGLVIDLSAMKGIHVDARTRTARAQGGVVWGELDRETQLHGLATTGGIVSTTGIAGLTLGGGLGWLMGRHGLAVDNVLSADLVAADGRVLHAAADENPDLFWGLRGGGGNLGVAVSFEYRLHPVGPTVTGGLIAHPLSAGRELLRVFREVTASAPDELAMDAALLTAPDGSTRLAAVATCHCGSPRDGEAALRPIRSFGSPIMDTVGAIPYTAVNSMLDAMYPRGALNYWKSHFLAELADEALDAMLGAFARCPSPMSNIVIEHLHGAATRVPVADTAFAMRSPGYNVLVLSQWTDPAQSEDNIAWARETYAALQPFCAGPRYVNYLDRDDTEAAVAAAYGPNHPRLSEIKARYDPENFFHLNHNVRPLA